MSEDSKTFQDMVDGIRTAVLTTRVDGERLHGRPMAVQEVTDDNVVWMLTFTDSDKVHEIQADSAVALVFVDGENYVSAWGHAAVSGDVDKKRELWNPFAEAWLQCEPEDPKASLIRIDLEGAEFWDSPSKPRQLLGVAKAMVTGSTPEDGDSGTLDL